MSESIIILKYIPGWKHLFTRKQIWSFCTLHCFILRIKYASMNQPIFGNHTCTFALLGPENKKFHSNRSGRHLEICIQLFLWAVLRVKHVAVNVGFHTVVLDQQGGVKVCYSIVNCHISQFLVSKHWFNVCQTIAFPRRQFQSIYSLY